MLRTTACWKELPIYTYAPLHTREYALGPEVWCSLFLMDLILPERYSAATDLQYRRRIQARQHGLVQ